MKKNMRAGWGAKEEQENKPGERMSCSLKKDLATPMEVLAPAGSMESLRAAVRCGADAVYLGGIQFSARANAQNFGEEELREAVRYCHGRGVKVYLALNTLLLEEELPKAVEAAAFAASLPVDAILVQDMGLLRLLKRLTPGLPLHASTQMSIHTPAGARALWEAGCSRVVLSREMSLSEIGEVSKAVPVELEAFVHGALCMSVSGQCYMSSVLGGRSGNRGLCAQPCRLPFSCEGGTGHDLSLKDLSMIRRMGELSRAGVVCAKIEGRMKRPEYVAAAVSACRRAADGEPVPGELTRNLEAVFSRSGFTSGYPDGKRGREMFGIRSKEDVEAASSQVFGALRGLYREEAQRVSLEMECSILLGEPARLTVHDREGRRVSALGEVPQAALTRPLDEERCRTQLTKTGGTPFRVERFSLQLGEGLSLPLSSLNHLRREVLEKLLQKREERPPISLDKEALEGLLQVSAHRAKTDTLPLRARFSSPDLPGEARSCELCYIPWETGPEDWERLRGEGFSLGLEIPRGLFGMERAAGEKLRLWKEKGFSHVWAGNIGSVRLAKEADLTVHGGFSLNAVNSLSLLWLSEQGLADAELSFELSLPQAYRLGGELPRGVLVYGRLPLMLTRNCPAANGPSGCLHCRKTGKIPWLTDRKGIRFPVQCTGSCSEVLNSLPLELSDMLSSFRNLDFGVMRFTTESKKEQVSVLRRYFAGGAPEGEYTRGLSRRGFGSGEGKKK